MPKWHIVRALTSSIALLGVMVVGALLVASGNPTQIHAAEAPRLEIAPAGTTAWADTAGAAWTLSDARPGSSTTAGVALRLVNPPSSGALIVGVEPDGAAGSTFLDDLFVTSMTLDGAELLAAWGGCAAGPLTLLDLATCAAPPALPLPSEAGSEFAMQITVSDDLGNAGQGAVLGDFAVAFWVESEAPSPSPGDDDERDIEEPESTASPTPTGTPWPTPSGTPPATPPATPPTTPVAPPPLDPGGTSTPPAPSPDGAAAPDTGAGAPSPADTGHGVTAQLHLEQDGSPPALAGPLLLVALVAAGLLAARRTVRRRVEDER